MDCPQVSVVMPMYNSARFVRESVESVLAQTFRDFELIVIDDGSSDDGAAIIASINDSRIRLLRNAENRGIVYTRNRGIQEARGAYVAVLDSDDLAPPYRLKRQVDHMERNPQLAGCSGWAYTLWPNGRRTMTGGFALPGSHLVPALMFANWVTHSTVMLRTKFLPDPAYRSEFPLAEDYDLVVRLVQHGRFEVIPEPLVDYRRNESGVSNSKAAQMESCVRRVIVTQLEDFGVKPNNREIEIHRYISRRNLPVSVELLDEIEAWLDKLLALNGSTRKFDESIFLGVLAYAWFVACRATTGVGGGVQIRYWRSRYSRTRTGITRLELLRFVAKSLLGWPGC